MEISEEQLKLNQSLHQKNTSFGNRYSAPGARNLPFALRRMHEIGLCFSVLDYGTGKGLLVQRLRDELPSTISVSGYDPAVECWSKKPNEKFDIVTSFDVLEHVEINLIDNVINHLATLTRYICYVVIDLQPAIKQLDDGRNAHICLAPLDWWISRFGQRFNSMVSFPIMHSCGKAQKVVIACTHDARFLPQIYSFLNKINSYDLILEGGYLSKSDHC